MNKFENWYKEIVDSEDGLSGYPAGVCSCGKEGYHIECQQRLLRIREENSYIESLVSNLGYQLLSDQTDKEFVDAENAIFEKLNVDLSYETYNRNNVLEGPTAFYFPICGIGSCGHLVLKGSNEVVSFGSYVGKSEHIWAFHQGISMASLGKDRRNQFTINKIVDRENTIKVLKSFINSEYLKIEVIPHFDRLPLILKDLDLYFGIRDLIRARYENWFHYEIN